VLRAEEPRTTCARWRFSDDALGEVVKCLAGRKRHVFTIQARRTEADAGEWDNGSRLTGQAVGHSHHVMRECILRFLVGEEVKIGQHCALG